MTTNYEVDGVQALSRSSLAQWYGVSPDTVSRMLNDGTLPAVTVGTQHLVPLRALVAFEDELGREAARRLIADNTDA